ncbi:uncharacterized protein AMSG_04359 [Thecamonas trahens ATCC 50062]|uniref:Uncharacterized protein n=1 Tax=Thecamonas trahens ATCC 50062 TaxID=461836 RepID=A0A0L0D708_THETB|nr:hypothetical protein AMSG_04359 [Thecamonas trahens ATCC 50062]KNC48129.1 hypothetical protein AMSG_04359 [Thecamonas trahens ATCC 50062]|eukprot:XP_013758700.1 hypothetical protein AMSG_04359 [Thecamonas trahens ATCC 50062]
MGKGDGGKKKSKGKPKHGDDAPVFADDDRFARMHHDPRFMSRPKKERKVKIDHRFKAMFDDPRFQTQASVDKYGRKNKVSQAEELSKFYELSGSGSGSGSGSRVGSGSGSGSGEAAGSDVEAGSGSETESVSGGSESGSSSNKPMYDPSRGIGIISEYSESESEDEDAAKFEEEDSSVEEGYVVQDTVSKEKVPVGDAHRRLAIMNLDWEYIKAVDLLAILQSFCPPAGSVISVTIYPSQFGAEQMAIEDKHGPQLEDPAEEGEEKLYKVDAESLNQVNDAAKDEVDKAKLRAYQLRKMRYYYAVAVADSVETAHAIYEQVDGMELLQSSNFMDLRYVPDEVEFNDFPPRETATTHTNVELTWDTTPHDRVKVTQRKFTKDELRDMDFKAYLASVSDSSTDDDEAEALATAAKAADKLDAEERKKIKRKSKRNKYRSLLFGSGEQKSSASSSDASSSGEDDSASDSDVSSSSSIAPANDDGDVITFQTGVRSEVSQLVRAKLAAKQADGDDEGTGKEKERRREYRRQRKLELKQEQLEAELEAKMAGGKKRKRGSKPGDELDAKARAQLELLMSGSGSDSEDDGTGNFDFRNVVKAYKEETAPKRKRRKRGKKQAESASKASSQFDVDVNDSRFAPLLTSAAFAIDPNDPRFMRTRGMDTILEERRKHSEAVREAEAAEARAGGTTATKTEPANDGNDIKSLVQRAKARSKRRRRRRR